jgi:RNA polymerase sigma-70 factor (ECF subfamily)
MQKAAEVTELELIQHCKLGTLKHQELLYKHFYGYAMGIALRYLTNKDDAMEVVNDSFIKTFKGIKFYNETQPFKAWLRRIVVNTAIDQHRKNVKYTYQVDIEHATYESKAAEAIANLSAKDILNLLDTLPEHHRTIFNMYELDGYNHDEIAQMLQIPVSSSRVYLSRAKEKLRYYLTKQTETDYGRSKR